MKFTESQLQVQCIRWYDYQYPHFRQLLFSIPNGGKRGLITAVNMKREGARKGIADLFLSIPKRDYHGMYLELKSGKNDLTKEQQEFKKEVEKRNYKFEVIRSFDEFQREVEQYLK